MAMVQSAPAGPPESGGSSAVPLPSEVKEQMDGIVSIFRAFDTHCSGFISRADLTAVLQTLDPNFDTDNIDVFATMACACTGDADMIRYEELVAWLCEALVPSDVAQGTAECGIASAADEAAMAVFTAMGGYECLEDLGRKSRPENFHCILQGRLYMGGSAVEEAELQTVGITHVVRVLEEEEPAILPHEDLIGSLFLCCADTPDFDLRPRLPEACDFIAAALRSSGRVYVHCGVGRSRSCAVVLAYLLSGERMSLREALAHVFAIRDVSALNLSFLAQIVDYEEDIKNSSSLPLLGAFLAKARIDKNIAEDRSKPFDASEVQTLWRSPKARTRPVETTPMMASLMMKSAVRDLNNFLHGRLDEHSERFRPLTTRCGQALVVWLDEHV